MNWTTFLNGFLVTFMICMSINAIGSKATENVGVVSALLVIAAAILFVGLRL